MLSGLGTTHDPKHLLGPHSSPMQLARPQFLLAGQCLIWHLLNHRHSCRREVSLQANRMDMLSGLVRHISREIEIEHCSCSQHR